MKHFIRFFALIFSVLTLLCCEKKSIEDREEPAVLSDECKLLSIKAEGQIGETVPPSPGKTSFLMYIDASVDPTAVNVEVEVSEGASIVPSPDQPIDFSSGSVTFTVTSESGIIDQNYVVNAVFQSSECKILSVSAREQYGETVLPEGNDNTISLLIDYYSDITKVKLEFEISEKAVLTPEITSITTFDFSNGPLEFTVTAESGQQRTYLVDVTHREQPAALPTDYAEDEIKVMTFNIREQNPLDGAGQWIYRRESIVEMVYDHVPSVLGIQEGSYYSEWAYLRDNLSDHYVMTNYGLDSAIAFYMSVFYNTRQLELLDSGGFWLSETPDELSMGWDANNLRHAAWALFKHKATGKIFFHLNTHLDHIGDIAQYEGLKLIIERCKKYNPEGYPEVLTADFNLWETDSAMRLLDEKYVHVSKVAPSDRTYDGGTPRGVDHIYVTKDVEVFEYSNVSESYNAPYLSDHEPKYAIVRF